jgi:hypothetical protein
LGAVNLRTLKKSFRGKRKYRQQKSRYYVKTVDARNKPKTALLRGQYFAKLRRERKLLSILSKCPPNLNSGRRERRILRYIYYCILPILFFRLDYYRDREILLDLEAAYLDSLNIINLNRGVTHRVNRLDGYHFMTHHQRESLCRQSSIEPMHGLDVSVDSFGTTW